MAISNSICTKDIAISIVSGTGPINIGTDSTDKSINIGSSSINSGSILIDLGATTISIGGSGNQTINVGSTSGTSSLTINSGTGSINLGSSAGNPNVVIGNTDGSTAVTFTTGTGTMFIGTGVDKTINIGNTDGATSIVLNTGTGALDIGANAVAKTITIGNTTGATGIVMNYATGGIGFPVIEQTGTSVTMAPGIYYIANNASLVTLTLPSSIAANSVFRVIGKGAGGWSIAQNASQTIVSTANSTTTGVTGSLSSGGQYDAVEIKVNNGDLNTLTIASFTGTLSFA